MIQIDIPMPARCAECPCNGNRLYGNCQVKGRWLGGEEGSPMAENRPECCPLKEEKQDAGL